MRDRDVPVSQGALTPQAAWTSPAMRALPLVSLFIDEHGGAALSWEPETIRAAIDESAGGVAPRGSFDRLMAAIALLRDDNFYVDVDAFIRITRVLRGGLLEETTPLVDPAELLGAIFEAMLIAQPSPDDAAPFSRPVRRYVSHVLREEGIAFPPDLLALADLPVRGEPTAEDLEKNRRITEIFRENVLELQTQLATIPLHEGSTTSLCEGLSKVIERLSRSTNSTPEERADDGRENQSRETEDRES